MKVTYISAVFGFRPLLFFLTVLLCSYTWIGSIWAQRLTSPSISIEAAQVGSVANSADAARVTKSWADKTKQGIDSMVIQEFGVTKEIQAGIDRLAKSCEVANSLKQNSARLDSSNIASYEKLIDQRLAARQKNRTDLLVSIDLLTQKVSKDASSSCGFLGLMAKDPIACEVEKYKKEMIGVFTDGVNRFYENIFKRYGQYKLVVNQAKTGCLQQDFLGRLLQADTEYLLPYEDRAYTVFSRLIESVSAAFLNQANN